MTKTHLDPPAIAPPRGYSHVVVVEGGRLAFVAGQVALDRDGTLVGEGDVVAQACQCFANVRAALEAVGATASDLVKLTTFVVGFQPADRDPIIAARDEVLDFAVPPASTLVGIERLVNDAFLIEVEAVALVP
jgi:enamine deaminase RidA (YjgF/YER057c/UK114 family)